MATWRWRTRRPCAWPASRQPRKTLTAAPSFAIHAAASPPACCATTQWTWLRMSSLTKPSPNSTRQQHALSLGVTLINDMGAWSHLETYRRALDRGDLELRIYSFVPLGTWERLNEFVAANGRGDSRLMWGGLKGFVDGSLGSTTAWFYEPYDDAPETAGLLTTDTTALRTWVKSADSAGLHVAVHAIGDRANDWLLDVFAEAEAGNGERDRRFRIEHSQNLTPYANERMAALGVIASMQPYHAIDD